MSKFHIQLILKLHIEIFWCGLIITLNYIQPKTEQFKKSPFFSNETVTEKGDRDRFQIFVILFGIEVVKTVYNNHPRDPELWPLLTGGRCTGVTL